MTTLVILWHMHQPEYADPATGEYVLPWTRLHAVKDYDEFADVLAEFPDVHTTVNITPVLCGQLEALGQGARDVYGSVSAKSASYLTQVEREFILANFFKANFETMIRPHERYAEILFERGREATPARIHEAARIFSVQKMRDLQVWANLAWSGSYLRQTDPVVSELLEKGRDFTEEEKLALLQVHQRVCAGVLEKYKRLQQNGIIEISTTPYYHPILPLLLDMNDAADACPGLILPQQTRVFAEDARWHVESALASAERRFGRRPDGMWPSEGSVSEKTCDLLASCGVKWAATDEKILEKSLNGQIDGPFSQALANIYSLATPHGDVRFFFRNHDLSDRVGFMYASRPVDESVADFLAGVRDAGKDPSSVVSVILDGENAWEYFRGGTCRPFLTELLGALQTSGITTRTCSECIRAADVTPKTLERIRPGSWINGNFNIWIGHPEDNAGWDAVQSVRDIAERMIPGTQRDKAMRLLRIAEGSDWYWWFGDDHSSEDDPMFDKLFRDNLATICALAGEPPPKSVLEPIKRSRSIQIAKPPTELFTPTVDGSIRPFYEWIGAGRVDMSFMAGAMHKAIYHLQRIFWGFDESHIHLCLETVKLPEGSEIRLTFRTADGQTRANLPVGHPSAARLQSHGGECSVLCAFGDVTEVSIPLAILNLDAGANFFISVALTVEGMEIERWPIGKELELFVPDPSFLSAQWMV